ncbi:aspartate/glutamate racemase family protein [Thermoproteota archaeon]
MNTKHIGIVACSAEGAALCYRTICVECEEMMGRQAHPEITMHTHSLSEYMLYIETGDWRGVANLMLSSANKLTKAGADFAICPDNTIHQAFDLVKEKSSIPWLHIAEEVAVEAKRRGHHYLGILGTSYLMESRVYPNKLARVGIKSRIPKVKQREQINSIIFTELVRGILSSNTREYLCKIIAEFKQYECDAVVLGCTELPLLISQKDSPLPVLDSTRILARAALKKSINTNH